MPARRPVRPKRCLNEEIDLGAPIWPMDFTDPMSIPNSSVEVQIAVVGRLLVFSRSSRSLASADTGAADILRKEHAELQAPIVLNAMSPLAQRSTSTEI